MEHVRRLEPEFRRLSASALTAASNVSHLLGFSYAPRFKNLERQRLYIFRSRKGSDRSAWKIKPAGYADDEIPLRSER
jgi:hypothetical protein